jgi:hypothetical protein
VIGTGDEQIRDAPEDFGARTDIFLLDRNLKFIDQGLMAWRNVLVSGGISIPPVCRKA